MHFIDYDFNREWFWNLYHKSFISTLKIKSRDISKPKYMKYIILDNNAMIGLLIYHFIYDVVYIDYLVIDSVFQNRGYGKNIIKTFIDKYQDVSCDCVHTLVPYYTKLGFRQYKDLDFGVVRTKLMTTTFKNILRVFSILMKRLCKCAYSPRWHDPEIDIKLISFDKENP